jgi:hypothetical protein
MRGERRDERDVSVGPIARFAGACGQRPDHALVMGERRDQVAGEFDDAGVSIDTGGRIGPGVRPRLGSTRPQYLVDPPVVDAECREGCRDVVVDPRPGGELQLVVAKEADRDEIDSECALRLVDDRAKQLLAIVRRSEAFGDAEEAVEAFGELGFEVGARLRRDGRRDVWIGDGKQLAEHGWPCRLGIPCGARTSNDAGANTRGHRVHSPIGGPARDPRQRYRLASMVVLGRSTYVPPRHVSAGAMSLRHTRSRRMSTRQPPQRHVFRSLSRWRTLIHPICVCASDITNCHLRALYARPMTLTEFLKLVH